MLVSAGAPVQSMGQLRFPFAAIVPQDGAADPDEPKIWTTTLEVTILAQVASDTWGEAVLIGGPRAGGQGSSQGRGLVELEEELRKAIRFLDSTNSVKIRAIGKSAVAAVVAEDLGGYVASRAYRYEVLTTDERSYPAPTRFTAVDATGGDADLAWTLPPDRYDRHALVLRRAAGAVPPATPTAGTDVPVGALVTTLTDSPGAGEFSYALFMGYDELNTPTSAADRFSSAATATVTVT